jgi:GT2 family glycosyltransferase
MDLSIVIVNYKTPGLLLQCIDSIYKETDEITFEIIVVDNHSCDNSKEFICSKFPAVKWLDMGYNSGFSRANNYGLNHSKGEYVLFLNSDTIIQKHALDKCLKFAASIPDLGFLGCKLLNSDFTIQKSVYFSTASFREVFSYNPIISFFARRIGVKLYSTPTQIKALMGAFLMGKTNLIKEIEGFDDDFFMYSEEFELCNRLQKRGKTLHYFPDAEIVHIGGASNGFSKRTEIQRFLSVLLLFLKIHGRLGLIAAIAIYKLNIFSEWIYYPFLSNSGKSKVINGTKVFIRSLPYMLRIIFLYQSKKGTGKHLLKYEE